MVNIYKFVSDSIHKQQVLPTNHLLERELLSAKSRPSGADGEARAHAGL